MKLRQIDMEIAQKVFGYKVRRNISIAQEIFEYEHTNVNYPDRKVWLDLPKYSYDLNEAMKVVEKLGEFQITFSTGEWTVDQFLPKVGLRRMRSKYKTLPELICIAALERVKATEEYKRNNS